MARESYRISGPAGHDIDEIYDRIAADNISASARVVIGLRETFEQLAQHPELGTKREELGNRLRSMTAQAPASAYVVYYRVVGDVLEVVRVLHGAREISTEF